jgi:hypothetical protein
VNVAAPHDGSGRIFVVERGGTIRIIDKDGNLLPDPFLDWTGQAMSAFLEQGMLGLAFHPNFAQTSSARMAVCTSGMATAGWRVIRSKPDRTSTPI